MNNPDEIDNAAEEWFNNFVPKLRYSQDYSICVGHSRRSENKIEIARPYIRLFSTGVTKIYRMAVLGETLEDVVYTKEEEDKMDKDFEAAETRHAKSKGEGWE